MSHPVAKHISKQQDHELNHWLKNNGFRQTDDNQETLCDLIDAAKTHYGKTSTQHLTHEELNQYFNENSKNWFFEVKL